MLHLIDDIRADHSFNGDSRSKSGDTVIYINDMSHYDETRHLPPAMSFASLNEALASFGDFSTFMESIFPLEGDTYLMLDEGDLNRLHVHHLLSVWPDLSLESVTVILKSFYIHHRFSRSDDSVDARGRHRLTSPSRSYIRALYDMVKINQGYDREMKRHLGYEYLLAHSLAVDFDENDEFVQLFAQKMDRMLWKSTSRDFVKRRMFMLFNVYQVAGLFKPAIDLEREDIDRQFRSGSSKAFFDLNVGYKDVQYLKDHYSTIRSLLDVIDDQSGIWEAVEDAVNQRLDPTRPLSVQEVKELVEIDKQKGWSFLFGREDLTKDTNAVFVNYLYNATQDQLNEFVLQ